MNIVQYLTPINLVSEQEKFFASSSYHPRFQYQWNEAEMKAWQATTDEQKLLTALRAQAYTQAVLYAKQLFQTEISAEVLQAAQRYLTKPEQQAQPSLSAIEAAFTKAFQQIGLTEYRLVVSDQQGFNFRPDTRLKQLVMSSAASFDYLTLESEVLHEVAHIIRSENSYANQIPFSSGYLATEEGLACVCQDYALGTRQSSLFQHAVEYAATEIGLHGSLRDVYDFMRECGFSALLAWQRAARHKFGWIDTRRPGDLMKPAMYFFHEQQVLKLSVAERYRLFTGKIRLDELSIYPEYRGRVSLQTLRDFYPFKNS